jgi:hypothetical protein
MDAHLVSEWQALCQSLRPAFTAPTFVTFLHIVTGWVLCRSKPTVTNLVRTIGHRLLGHAAKHWSTYERFFYWARWSVDEVSALLLQRVVAPLVRSHGDGPSGVPGVIDLLIDGTTAGRCGRHVAFAGYFKDASASNTLRSVCHWSHQWVIGAVALRPKRYAPWVTALPVLASLYRKPGDCDKDHPFQTQQQLAARMIEQAHDALPDWTLRVTADGQYATKDVIDALPTGVNLVSRLRCDAALHALPPTKRRAGPGRPRKKGKRLPTPRTMANRRTKGWQAVEVRKGSATVRRELYSLVCLWYGVCKDRPIKLVIARDPSGQQRDDFFFCTDPTVSAEEVAERYYARWPIEEAIQEAKQHHGFEQVQGWCPATVQRQAPLALFVETLVKAWFLRHGQKRSVAHPKGAQAYGWMPEKDHPSYLDMLATLRGVLWEHRINGNSALWPRMRKIFQPLKFTLCAAA